MRHRRTQTILCICGWPKLKALRFYACMFFVQIWYNVRCAAAYIAFNVYYEFLLQQQYQTPTAAAITTTKLSFFLLWTKNVCFCDFPSDAGKEKLIEREKANTTYMSSFEHRTLKCRRFKKFTIFFLLATVGYCDRWVMSEAVESIYLSHNTSLLMYVYYLHFPQN